MPVGSKMRKIELLGAFEIQGESEAPNRDGLILGSRRMQLGFVLETSRESIEQIVQVASSRPGLPRRLTQSIGPLLRTLGREILRVELMPLPIDDEDDEEEGYGAYVQGFLVFRQPGWGSHKLPVTATEAIQISLYNNIPLQAHLELLKMNVSNLLTEIDAMTVEHQKETKKFRRFVDSVTATDFAKFYEARGDRNPDEEG